MKKISLYSVLFCATINISQAQNPFASIGKKTKPMLTLSNGRYEEHFENDSIRQVGSVMVNIKSEKIVAFVDRKEQSNKIHAQTTSRFLSIDPLARSFPWNSPYSYAENRPIDGIDLDGKEWSKTTTYDPMNNQFNVQYKVKIQIIDATKCAYTAQEKQDIAAGIQAQFKTTYTQFDKDKNINYTAELEYEFIDGNPEKVGLEGSLTITLKDAQIKLNGKYDGGSTPARSKNANTQTNVIRINTNVAGKKRSVDEIARTTVHELGHSAGLEHPWEIINGTAQSDAKQGTASDNNVKLNIMNSGANPNAKNRYIEGSGVKAETTTPGQLKEIGNSIDIDTKK